MIGLYWLEKTVSFLAEKEERIKRKEKREKTAKTKCKKNENRYKKTRLYSSTCNFKI